MLAVWDLMEDNASRATPRGTLVGWDDEGAAIALDIEPQAVASIREAMQGKALDGMRIIDWETEQPKRERVDDSKDRVRAFRERQRQETPEKPKSRRVTPRNATKRTDRGEEIEKKEETELQPPPPEGARAAPDAGENLLGWWIKREEKATGARPPDSEIGKQGRAARLICEERTPEQINRAIQGMPHLFKYSRGQPWDLLDFKREFQAALTAPVTDGGSNGNGRSNGTGRGDRDAWRYRQQGQSVADGDPTIVPDDFGG